MFGGAILFLLFAILYVVLKNKNHGHEKDDELDAYKRQLDRSDEQLRRKEISKETYDL